MHSTQNVSGGVENPGQLVDRENSSSIQIVKSLKLPFEEFVLAVGSESNN